MIPVITPEAEIVELPVVVLHKPAEPPSVAVVVAPAHKVAALTTLPASGNVSMVINCHAVTVPQELVVEYFTVSIPVEIPLMTPVTEMPIWPAAALHSPPATVSVAVVVAPAHKEAAVTTVPATANGLIVINCDAAAVPHEFVMVYFMVSVPIEIPVISPEDKILEWPVASLQTPPAVASVAVIVAPTHTSAGLAIGEAEGTL